MKRKLSLCETNISTLESLPKEIKKLSLSNLSSEELIRSITISKEIQELNFEILFERADKLALRFQSQTLEQWAKGLLREQSLDSLFCLKNKDTWTALILNYLTKPEATILCKLYSSLLLDYFWGADFEKIKTNLVKITDETRGLPAPEISKHIAYIKDRHEAQRTFFLTAFTVNRMSNEMFQLILQQIQQCSSEPQIRYDIPSFISKGISQQQFYYDILVSRVADFNEEQLNTVIYSCFKKALEERFCKPNLALEALKGIMKHLSNLPEGIQDFFIEIIKDKKINLQGPLREDFAFILLFEHAKFNNRALFKELLNLAFDKLPETPALDWISKLSSLLPLDDQLISLLIDNLRKFKLLSTYTVIDLVKSIAKNFTNNQLVNFSNQCLSLLNERNSNDDLVNGSKLIGILASSFSPCPQEFIQSLVNLTRHREGIIARAARRALMQLEPNILVIKSGILEKELSSYENVYEYIIKLTSLISAKDIPATLIKGLINIQINLSLRELKKKALAAIALILDEQQLTVYINSCFQHNQPENLALCLTAIPSSRLLGKIDWLIKKYTNDLENEDPKIREEACNSINYFEEIFELFPQYLLTNVVNKLNDDDPSVRTMAARTLSKILPFINEKNIEHIYEIFLKHFSPDDINLSSWICEYIGLLLPRLSQLSIKNAKKQFIASLDHKSWEIRFMSFNALVKIADYLKIKQLKALIKVLVSKAEERTFKYFRSLIKKITGDTIKDVLTALFEALKSESSLMRAEVCLTLIEIASCSFVTDIMRRQIISAFITILRKQEIDLEEQIEANADIYVAQPKDLTVVLRGLIELADFLTAEEFEGFLNLPITSFDMIATMQVLKVIYERKCELAKVDFLNAVLCNNTEVVGYYLNDSFIDPAHENNLALRCACQEGHVEMVRLLLTDPRVHPMQDIENPDDNDDIEDPLILACQHGRTEIVKLLLADPRVDPGEYENQAIQTAIIKGHAEIVELLLQDERVPALEGELLFLAVQEGYAKVLQLMLADWRFKSQLIISDFFENIDSKLSSFIHLATDNDNLDALELLLSHSVEPVTRETKLDPDYPQIKSALSCNKFGLFSEAINKKLDSKLSMITIDDLATKIKNTYDLGMIK